MPRFKPYDYDQTVNLEACERYALDAYVPGNSFRQRDSRFDSRGRHKAKGRERRAHFGIDDFEHDPETDRYTCPAGRELRLTARASRSRGGVYRRYRAVGDCTGCPFYQQCFARPGGKRPPNRRTLAIPVEGADESLCAAPRAVYARRQGIIEPVYGNLRYCKRLDRFHYRGIGRSTPSGSSTAWSTTSRNSPATAPPSRRGGSSHESATRKGPQDRNLRRRPPESPRSRRPSRYRIRWNAAEGIHLPPACSPKVSRQAPNPLRDHSIRQPRSALSFARDSATLDWKSP